jgi:hypothetical protein
VIAPEALLSKLSAEREDLAHVANTVLAHFPDLPGWLRSALAPRSGSAS